MAFSYRAAKIPDSGRDRIRFELGDTDSDNPLLQDEEIDAVITVEGGSFYRAAGMCAFTIARTFAREVSVSAGPLRLDLGARAKSYHEMADVFMAQAAREGTPGIPTAGGLPNDGEVETCRGVDDFPGNGPYRGTDRAYSAWGC